MFTWVPVHQAISKKLLEYESRQQELIDLLRKAGVEVPNDDDGKKQFPLKEIDPFTAYNLIYKYGEGRRLSTLNRLAELLEIKQQASDTHGVPSVNPFKPRVFPYKKDRTKTDIPNLWLLFHQTLAGKIEDGLFEWALNSPGYGRAMLSASLFMANPTLFFPVNKKTSELIEESGTDPLFNTRNEYLSIIDSVKTTYKKETYEISYEGWLSTSGTAEEPVPPYPNNINYWLYAPGDGARYWDEFFTKGIMCLGWPKLGNLNQYSTKDDINMAFQVINGTDTNKMNSVLANFEFAKAIKKGDVIIAKKGKYEYLGYGIVESDYLFDDTKDDYRSYRKVNWLKKGKWEEAVDNPIVMKALTNITKYPDYVNRLKKLIGINNLEKNAISGFIKQGTLNTILYGPPGTGKTYHTVENALSCLGINTFGRSRAELKDDFEKFVSDGRIVFTTFHQSLNYEDFVEGIKPGMNGGEGDGNINYKIEPGIFKKLAVEAAFALIRDSHNTEVDRLTEFDSAFQNLVDEAETFLQKNKKPMTLKTKTGNNILLEEISVHGNIIVRPENGKLPYIVSRERMSKLYLAIDDLNSVENFGESFVSIIGGNNSSVNWAVLNYLKTTHSNKKVVQKLNFNFEEKSTAVQNSRSDEFVSGSGENYVLIIDEINRGNISQIFGELITLIEDDKRLGKTEALTVMLPYSKEKFGVPPNLYIIGTMNTADRSVEALDTALRRRFGFIEMPPRYDLDELQRDILGNPLKKVLKRINFRLEHLLNKDHLIGHSYFLSVKNEEDLKLVLRNKILPLLQEYFFGDHGKIGLVLGKGFVRVTENTNGDSIFADFNGYDEADLADRKVYEVLDPMEMDSDEFETAINYLMA